MISKVQDFLIQWNFVSKEQERTRDFIPFSHFSSRLDYSYTFHKHSLPYKRKILPSRGILLSSKSNWLKQQPAFKIAFYPA